MDKIEKIKAEIKRLGEIEYLYSYDQCVGFYDALDRMESFIDSLQNELPKEICSKCIHHGKDDDYCHNPHGGIQSLINENGVYECTGFCEKEQKLRVDLEKDVESWFFNEISHKINVEHTMYHYFQECAQRYFELGKNSK